MVCIGTGLALLGMWYLCGADLPAARLPRDALVLSGARRWPRPLSLVALIAGWVTTEVGRQPWIVYRVMRTADAVTGAKGLPVGYATVDRRLPRCSPRLVVWLLRRLARSPLERQPPSDSVSADVAG